MRIENAVITQILWWDGTRGVESYEGQSTQYYISWSGLDIVPGSAVQTAESPVGATAALIEELGAEAGHRIDVVIRWNGDQGPDPDDGDITDGDFDSVEWDFVATASARWAPLDGVIVIYDEGGYEEDQVVVRGGEISSAMNDANPARDENWDIISLIEAGQTDGDLDDGRSWEWQPAETVGGGEKEKKMGNYIDNRDGTVTDNATGLMWQKEDDGTERSWQEALSYCKGLSLGGHTDWRLPSVKELQSIVDYDQYGPAIDENIFPGTALAYYWSSSVYAYNTDYAWLVGFNTGHVYRNFREYNYYVRCVR